MSNGVRPHEFFEIILTKPALKRYRRLPKELVRRVDQAFTELELNPFYGDVKRLEGDRGYYRLRVGDWEAIYRIDIEKRHVIVVAILPRGQVYK